MHRLSSLLLLLGSGCTVWVPSEAPVGMPDGQQRDGVVEVVRVVSWNIESLGTPGSRSYRAAQEVLARLDADVVLLQEIEWLDDAGAIDGFAEDAGYPFVHDGWPVSFGTDTQLILSRRPFLWTDLVDAADLVPGANDLTRALPVAAVAVQGRPLVVATGHLKAGRYGDGPFRRVVDAQRAVQALGPFDTDVDWVVWGGDVNDDLGDPPDRPSRWTTPPRELPRSYRLGDDVRETLATGGLPNDAFAPFDAVGLTPLPARQRSGTDATRPSSSRRLDYLFVSEALREGAVAEVYDTRDERLTGPLPWTGPVPTVDTLDAADHLPVVADLSLPVALPVSPSVAAPEGRSWEDLGVGDLRVTELMANPDRCDDDEGEWIELLNATPSAVDLRGIQLCDRVGCDEVFFPDASVVAAGEVAVLARTMDGCGVGALGTFDAALGNGGDEVALVGRQTLDAVEYPDAHPGISWVFDPERCEGPTQGTPGVALDCEGAPLGGEAR